MQTHKISKEMWFLLIIVGGAYLTSRYDFQLSTLTIPQFQSSLGLSDGAAQKITALVKLGALPAIIITFFADKIGRKPIFLSSVIGFSIASLIAANAQNANMLLLGLFLTRLFTMIGELLAVVLIAEAAPEDKRGLLLGLLAVFGTMGDAIAIISYGIVGDNDNSWRYMYMFGAFPALLAIWWKFALKESSAFIGAKQSHNGDVHPIIALKQSKKPMLILCAVLIFYWIPFSPALSLISQYLQNDMGWSPANISQLSIGAGVVGMIGTIYGGKLCDIFGRKIVAITSLFITTIGLLMAYHLNSFISVCAAYGIGLLGYFAFTAATRTLVTESVDTQARATAVSGTEIFASAGAFIGVQLVGTMADLNIKTNQSLIYLSPILVLCLIALFMVTETKGKKIT